MLTAPAFLLGPSTAGAGGTTPAATDTSVTAASAGARPSGTAAVASLESPATDRTAAPAAGPTPAPSGSPDRAPSSGTASGLSADPAPHMTATVTQSPWNKFRRVCGGKLTFGTVQTCGSIVDAQKNTWTVTTTADRDVLITQLRQSGFQYSLDAEVTDATGRRVCGVPTRSETCQLGAAGTYTITVTMSPPQGRGDYTLAVESTRTPSQCETLPESFFSFASPGLTRTLPAGAAAHCYTFDQPQGSVLRVDKPGAVLGDVLDSGYERVCSIDYGGMCTLNGPGPYRLLPREFSGAESTYTLKMPRLSNPVGCPPLTLAPFGEPGAAAGTGTVPQEDVACHAVTTDTPGPVLVRLDGFADQFVSWTVYDTSGSQVCTEYGNRRSCHLPAAGAYTLLLSNDRFDKETDYQVAVSRLDRNDGCAPAISTSWDQPSLHLTETSPVQTDCQPFLAEAGDRMITYVSAAGNAGTTWLVDSTGAEMCTEHSPDQDGCVLPAGGTFRVISYLAGSTASTDLTYRLQVRRLSDAAGCPTVTVGSYDTAPGTGGIRCRSLDVPEAGDYRLNTVTDDNYRSLHRVYDHDGLLVCGAGTGDIVSDTCTFPTAGRYTLVLDPYHFLENDLPHAVALLPSAPSACPTVSDTGWRDAPHRSAFQSAGQVNCLRLPGPAGSRIVKTAPGVLDDDQHAEMSVVDATGKMVCAPFSQRSYGCELRGEAPFFALLKATIGTSDSAYVMAFSRIDGPPACPVLARNTDTTVTTGPDRFVACYSIPADQHATRESFTWARTGGAGTAGVTVFDSRGVELCSPLRYATTQTMTCAELPEGPLTVLVETDGAAATYRLTHREATTA